MKFICTQENLHEGLLKVQGIASQATTLPILKNVLLKVEDGSLKLKATDLEVAVTTVVRGKVEGEGEITVEAKIISNFVALLPQDKVTLSLEGKHLIIKAGAHRTKINGLATEDFPVIPEIDKTRGFKISVVLLRQALAHIVPSVSPDDTRPEINGIFMKGEGEMLVFAGTDSFRLAEEKVALKGNGFQGEVIIPLKTIKELIRTIEGEELEVFVSENQILFSYNGTEMVSRLIDGKYPNYTQIIPTSFTNSLTIAKHDFVNATKIASIFASAGSNSITVDIKPGKKEMDISSAAQSGEERTTLAVDVEGEKDVVIVFDYRYLLQGLECIEDEEILFGINSEAAPALLKPKGTEKQFVYIVMPIRQ